MNLFRFILRDFRRNSGLRGPILKLLSGTGYAFIVGYVAKIALLRLYPVEAFGMFSFIFSIVIVFLPIVSLRYEDALMLPESRRDGAHAFLLAVISVVVLSSVLWLFLPLKGVIGSLYDSVEVVEWLWTIPLILLVAKLSKISELWLSRQEMFGRISVGQVANTSALVSVRIGAGLFTNSPGGLILGFISGHIAALLFFARHLRTTLTAAFDGRISVDRILFIAKRYRRFPAFTMPAAALSGIASQMPALLLLFYFDLTVLGHYSQAYSVLFIPLSLLGQAIAQVFFVRAVEARRNGTLADITDTIHDRLVLLALFPIIAIAIGGPDIFEFLFGEKWRIAGLMTRYIAPWVLFTAAASPLTRLFDVLERQRLELAISSVMFVVMTAALVVGGSRSDLWLTMILLAAGGSLVRIWQIGHLLHLAGVSSGRMLRPYLKYGLFVVPPAVLIGAAAAWSTPLVVTVSAALGGLVYFGIVLWRGNFLPTDNQPTDTDE